MFGHDDNVKIDDAHAQLLRGLIVAHKPTAILELGIGGGRSADAILAGLEYNQIEFDYTLVDNWMDFDYQQPHEVAEKYGRKIKILTSNERDFVFSCQQKFDFIMSDADHHQTDQWFEYVYDNLLRRNGILVYHDVNLIDPHAFPNLRRIHDKCQALSLSHALFNKNSLSYERCERGLLVIFKH